MNTNEKTVLVVGATGIIGRHAVTYFERTKNWKVIASATSPLRYQTNAQALRLDLTDPSAVVQNAEVLKNVTHVVFAAYIEKKTLAEQTSANLGLMKNLVDGLEQTSPGLRRILFIQGGKAYGAHLGRFKTPAVETDPRHFPPNFYYSQEDYLREKSKHKNWSWTAIRPDIIGGVAIGNPMNIANVLSVYASLCKELKVAFRFPGPLEAYNALVNMTDADVLGEALEWAALEDKAAGEIFNITNGDIFRWSQVWPKIAEYFEVEVAEPITFPLAEYMTDKEAVWKEMAERHGLANDSLAKLVQWPFGDFIFNNKYDAFFDVNKARRFGFQKMNGDTPGHLVKTFNELRRLKMIP